MSKATNTVVVRPLYGPTVSKEIYTLAIEFAVQLVTSEYPITSSAASLYSRAENDCMKQLRMLASGIDYRYYVNGSSPEFQITIAEDKTYPLTAQEREEVVAEVVKLLANGLRAYSEVMTPYSISEINFLAYLRTVALTSRLRVNPHYSIPMPKYDTMQDAKEAIFFDNIDRYSN